MADTGDAYTVVYDTFAAALGGGGGGGSSYVAASGVGGATVGAVTHASAGNGAAPALTRNPGFLEIKYSSC